jgi:hypothetical protein
MSNETLFRSLPPAVEAQRTDDKTVRPPDPSYRLGGGDRRQARRCIGQSIIKPASRSTA